MAKAPKTDPDAKFQLHRKQDGFTTDFITEEQAKGIAGYAEGEYEKLEPYKPLEVEDDEPGPADTTAGESTRGDSAANKDA